MNPILLAIAAFVVTLISAIVVSMSLKAKRYWITSLWIIMIIVLVVNILPTN